MRNDIQYDPDLLPEDDALQLANQALATLKTSPTDASRALLQRALHGHNLYALPAGFYIAALREAGEFALADWFLSACVDAGLDIVASIPFFEQWLGALPPTQAAALCRRYEVAFADGKFNATMIGHYAIALSRADEQDILAELCATDVLVSQQLIDTVDGFDSVAAFNRQLLNEMYLGAVHTHYDGRHYMRGVERMRKVHKLQGPAISTLIGLVRTAAGQYERGRMASLPESHLMKRLRPSHDKLNIWSNIYRPGAYVETHLHEQAWLVGVYYPQIADMDIEASPDGGMLKIGCPESLGGKPIDGWGNKAVSPLPGTLVLMPAYHYHWSVPYRGTGQRVAVTINWRPLRSSSF